MEAINCLAGLGNQDRKIENHIVQDYERAVTIGPGLLHRPSPIRLVATFGSPP